MLFPFSFMQSQSPFDPDAQAFFNRVTAAGGTLTATEKTAVNTLVLDLKANSLWTPMKAIYPMVGASAAACAQNLKSSSFTGTFTSGWTFASTGVTGNGTSAYMDSTVNTNGFSSLHYSYYSRTTNTSGRDMGNESPNPYDLIISLGGNLYQRFNTSSIIVSNANSNGFYVGTQDATNLHRAFRNSVQLGTTQPNNASYNNANVWIGGVNPSYYGSRECAFASIGDGLTDTQASNFYTAVQTFNQTLSRSVGPQIVSDADAQAYINRVYTAGGTLTNTEANAVNQLTIDMKAAGIWTAMKAVYPMVGSSAASCAQNLKSSSFTGTFTSGWTFASTGVTGNGTSAYFNSAFVPSSNGLTYDNNHISFYSRTSAQSGGTQYYDMGSGNSAATDNFALFTRRNTDTAGYDSGNFTTNRATFTNTNGQGFYCGTAPNTTSKYFKNGTSQVSKSLSLQSISGVNVYIGAFNENNATTYYSQKECAFASIGDGLTDTQAADFYTCVNTFQVSLSRNV